MARYQFIEEPRGGVGLEVQGFNEGTALLSEVLCRTDSDDWALKRFEASSMEEIEPLEEHSKQAFRNTGQIFGERLDRERHQQRFSVQAVLLPKLEFRPHEEGWRFYAIMDA